MLSDLEKAYVEEIKTKYYMPPVLQELNNLIENEKKSIKEVFSYLHPTILGAKDKVIKLLEERKKRGEIKDISQASKQKYCRFYIFKCNNISFFKSKRRRFS